MTGTREATHKIAVDYKQAIRDFLVSGGIDDLFSFIQSNSPLVRNPSISSSAKDMLRRALQQQHADAESYHALVKCAADANVPLFSKSTKE